MPAVLELVAVAFLLTGYRRARRGDSPSALWLLAAGIGGFAVYTNVVHSGGRSGLVFGAASAITLILWFVKLRDDYRHFQRQTGQATRPRPKLGLLWLIAPRLAVRAWVLAARRRISTVDEAVAYAEVWRAVFEDARSARVPRSLARRTAWRTVAEVAGGVYADLPRTAEIAAVNVVHRGAALPGDDATQELKHPAVGRAVPPRTPTDGVRHAPSEPRHAAVDPLRSQVFAHLDSKAKIDDTFNIHDGDDPYLLWKIAREGARASTPLPGMCLTGISRKPTIAVAGTPCDRPDEP